MKKMLAVLLALCLTVFAALPALAQAQLELIVFAAASMTESMNHAAEMYAKIVPDVKLIFNFDSSGTLKTQIENGADCDVFISASQKAMNQLDALDQTGVNTAAADFVDDKTRFDLVSNVCALTVPEGNPAKVESFWDLATDKVKTIALGNSDVPVGMYSEEIFKYLGLWDAVKEKATFGGNVKEVTAWISEGAVDCGVCYATDAYSAGLEWVAVNEPEWCASVIYPAAALKTAKNPDAARAFLDFLKTDEVRNYLKTIGFGIPSEK